MLAGLLLILAGAEGFAAPNAVGWNFIGLPESGTTGQTIAFSTSVTNTGAAAWSGDYFLELRDDAGTRLDYADLGTTRPGTTKTAGFTLTLPERPGVYTYHFTALQLGREYFGPLLERTIVVRKPPLDVSLAVARAAIFVGQRATVRSAAEPHAEVALHGLEVRPLGGTWQTWAEWTQQEGEQIASAEPPAPGIYEMRAFAARAEDEDVTYSPRALLTVAAIPPAITLHPTGAVANVGETVTLSVGATGTQPVYQWRRDGVDVPGATGTTLALSPAQVGQSGSYDVVVANIAGHSVSNAATIVVRPLNLPALGVEVFTFPISGGKRPVTPGAAQVGDVVSIRSTSHLTAGTGWRHNILVRRPAVTSSGALAPEDGSGLTLAHEAWNKDGWGNPHTDGNSFDPRVAGSAAVDLGNREPFIHQLAAGQRSSSRAVDFVLDAPGAWLIRAEVLDDAGQLIAVSSTNTINVAAPALAGDPANISYPYGRTDRFVGVFWNAGQAHRLWSTWRAEFQTAYRATWAVNWKLMWQPSPYFRAREGGWLRPTPAPESPWQPFWSAHQVYALVPDGQGASLLSHDLTSQAFAEKAALRLMDIGVDFVAVDYTNQFLEEREDVFPAVDNLAGAFQAVALRSQSGQRVKLTAVVPANITSGDWERNGGFEPAAIARFNAKLTTLHHRFARFEPAWFYLEDDNRVRKPLLLLWVGGSGEGEPDGTLSPTLLSQLRLADGRAMTEVFTIRWVGAYLSGNDRFRTGGSYTVNTATGPVSGKYANAKIWSYHEHFPSAATILPGATGATPAVEAVTVQPLAEGRDRFDRAWQMNWPAGEGYHYETLVRPEPVPLASYGKIWREALAAARALDPKFLLTTWAEFGSENDEPRPELSVTIMDNNKFGTHFGDALKETVRLFKYQQPTAWIDTYALGATTVMLGDMSSSSPLSLRPEQTIRLQGWVSPNVATTFAGGSVKIFVNDALLGTATVGGAWNGATRWYFDLSGATVGAGAHVIKVLADDGVGGTSLAGVQLRGEPPRNTLPISVSGTGSGR